MLLGATLVLILVGCSRPEPVVAEVTPVGSGSSAVAPIPTAAPTVESSVPRSPLLPPPPEPRIMAREEDAPALGTLCADGPACGLRGRIAIRSFASQRVGMRLRTPCSMVSLTAQPSGAYSKNACVEGDRVYFQGECIMCRLPSGTFTEGVISEMTEPQREFLRKQLELPEAAKDLATANAWRGAIASARSRAGGH